MPEYLSPGVYVEEVSFRSKSIQGVPTSTTGFAGMTRYGPVQYNDDGVRPGPSTSEPRLVTSFTEFERIYGGLEPLLIDDEERPCYLAHAARAFFMNGGQRLYVSRVYGPRGPADPPVDFGVANMLVTVDGPSTATWRARWPGELGNEVWLEIRATRSGNVAFEWPEDPLDPLDRHLWGVQAKSARAGTVVEIIDPPPAPPNRPPKGNDDFAPNTLAMVTRAPTGQQTFRRGGANVAVNPGAIIQIVELSVTVRVDDASQRLDFYDRLSPDPRQPRFIGRVLQRDDPADENAVVWLDLDDWDTSNEDAPIALLQALRGNFGYLINGHDGDLISGADIRGNEADPDVVTVKATGLEALGEIDDIAIVAAPDAATYDDVTLCQDATEAVVDHAEKFRYRIAVVDGPRESSMTEIRAFRGKFDTTRGAIYHPWIEIFDPLQRPAQGVPPPRILLPPSGFVTGIYARSDVQRGVFKAPANEVVSGLTRFEININRRRQDVLNPEGINALRFFEGRGNRVWGARTMTSDPEWIYVNVRRLFIFLEHSIDKSTQWAVFEPNNERLWANIRFTIEDFLLLQWKNGALMGSKPEEAYFVRCDRTTMTQNDLDNGRLICLIGVAPTKPAEFVIFRIGQWTADSKLT
jgi:phage tail sheath protein FI